MAINPDNFPHVLERYLELDVQKTRILEGLYASVERFEKELKRLSELIDDQRRPLEERMDIYQDFQQNQRNRTSNLAAIQKIERSPSHIHDDAFIEQRRQEFAKICSFPQVLHAFVDDRGAINIVVRASYVYEGQKYDLGDWSIQFGIVGDDLTYDVMVFRLNTNPEWTGDPIYLLSGGRFCLGGSRSIIGSYFDSERYVQAVQLSIYAVNSVNEQHVELLPSAFYTDEPPKIGVLTSQPLVIGLTIST